MILIQQSPLPLPLTKLFVVYLQVTVVVKQHACAVDDDYLLFVAYGGYLPAVFVDGSFEAGPDGAVFVDELLANQHVEILLRYVDTTIVIRQTSEHYFNVGIKTPQDILDATLIKAHTEPSDVLPVQLCLNSCPPSELIDYREILVQSHLLQLQPASERRRASSRDVSGKQRQQQQVLYTAVMSRDVALDNCQRAGLVDYYLDSCVLDLMLTGNTNLTAAVQLAQNDEFRLVPELAKKHLNRTDLNRTELARWESENAGSSASAASSTLGVSYVTLFCILFISHLNYIHKTTYVLLQLLF